MSSAVEPSIEIKDKLAMLIFALKTDLETVRKQRAVEMARVGKLNEACRKDTELLFKGKLSERQPTRRMRTSGFSTSWSQST